jgi:hypothetical protein
MVLLVSYFLLYKRLSNEGLDAQSAIGDSAVYGERFCGIIMSGEWSLTAMEGRWSSAPKAVEDTGARAFAERMLKA